MKSKYCRFGNVGSYGIALLVLFGFTLDANAAEEELTPCGKVGEIAMWTTFIGGSGAKPEDMITALRQQSPKLFEGNPKSDEELKSMVVDIQQLKIPVATSVFKIKAAMTKAIWYGEYYRIRCELETQHSTVKPLLESVPEIEHCSKMKKVDAKTYEACLLPRVKSQVN